MGNPSDKIATKLDAGGAVRPAPIALGLAALLIVIFGGAILSGHAVLLQNRYVQLALAIAISMLVLTALLGFNRRCVTLAGAGDPSIVRKQIDLHHRRWRWLLLSNLAVATFCVWSLAHALSLQLTVADRPYIVVLSAVIVIVIAVYSAHCLAGPGGFDPRMHDLLNDEFVRNLRTRTVGFGYGIMFLAAAATLVIGAWRPDLTLIALSWALYAGFAAPALYYLFADWRAGR